MSTPIIRPALAPTHEHLFTPLVWVSYRDGTWQVRFDWSDSYQYSHDIEAAVNVGPNAEGFPDVDRIPAPDVEYACELVDTLIKNGQLPPNSDTDKALQPFVSIPSSVPDLDPMEFWA